MNFISSVSSVCLVMEGGYFSSLKESRYYIASVHIFVYFLSSFYETSEAISIFILKFVLVLFCLILRRCSVGVLSCNLYSILLYVFAGIYPVRFDFIAFFTIRDL